MAWREEVHILKKNFAIYFFCNSIPLNLCIKTIHFCCNIKTRFSLKCFVYTLQPCNTNKCPVWSDWSSWSVCSVTCGGGNQFQNRKCVLPDGTSAQGLFCPGESQHVEKCNENKCPGLALIFNIWLIISSYKNLCFILKYLFLCVFLLVTLGSLLFSFT